MIEVQQVTDISTWLQAGIDQQDIFDDSLEIELVVGVDVDRVLQSVLLVVHVQHGQGLLHRIGTYSYSSWAPSGSFSMAGVGERDTSGRDSRLVDDL